MNRRGFICLILAVLLLAGLCCPSAKAYQDTTLRYGMRGDDVAKLQQALIDQGFLSGTADGVFGVNTENAVRRFQKKNRLNADGLAGLKTQALLYKISGTASSVSSSSSSSSSSASSSSKSSSSGAESAYSTLRFGDTGDRVSSLQKSLIDLGYLGGTVDGKFGKNTRSAVYRFQKKNKLTADGLAGEKTLRAIEKAVAAKSSSSSSQSSSETKSSESSTGTSSVKISADAGKMSAPDGSSVKLLYWYDDVKPRLKAKQTILVYEPVSGLGWHLRVYSRGRHLDAEPLTAEDTQIMLKAFGGKNTWNQKGVYVRLPDGTWTVGATHDMPHMSGTINDNGFDGHLCVHFLRTMAECTEKDPNYGVSNQRTIRALWKKLTGKEIAD